MEWIVNEMNRLYELYECFIDRLRRDVIAANRSLGAVEPERIDLDVLPRSEFESLVRGPTDDPEVIRLWIRRIVRGHEREFPGLRAKKTRNGHHAASNHEPAQRRRTAT